MSFTNQYCKWIVIKQLLPIRSTKFIHSFYGVNHFKFLDYLHFMGKKLEVLS